MKRSIAAFLSILLIFTIAGCKKNTDSTDSDEYEVMSEYEIVSGGEASDGENSKNTDTGSSNSGKNNNSDKKNNSKKENVSVIDTAKITTVDGLNFGGRTLKMAITNDKTPTESEKRMFADFESTYNCKLKYDVINFDGYLKTISNKIAANEPYDIMYVHGSMFPSAAISRLVAPLDAAIYDKDKINKSNPQNGGIDTEKSSYFAWNGKTYAVAGYKDVNLYFMYYNKQKFKAGNLPDPLELYNSGEWTWDKVLEIGKKVTDVNKRTFFGDGSFVEKAIVESFGGHYIKKNSAKDVKENTSDSKVFNGLKYIQRIANGADQIITLSAGNGADPSEFLSGRTYAFISEDIRYSASLSNAVIDDNKFGGNLDNIGIVPLPLGDGNKEYPAGWIQGIAACRGASDITPAVAFAKFRSTWKDSKADKYAFPQYAEDLRIKLLPNINYVDYGYSNNGNSNTSTVSSTVHVIEYAVAGGQNIKSTLDTYKNSIQNCIDVTLKKQ